VKTLLLFRHGKSDWEADYTGDHERPLKGRGRKDADRMGRFLAANGPLPDLCLTSTAVRARTTLERAHRAGGWEAPVHATPDLYHAGAREVLEVIGRVDDSVETLLVTGHEPTLSETVETLIGGGAVEMPTGALACIDLEVEAWDEVARGDGLLRWLVIPKALKQAYKEKKAAPEGGPPEGGASEDTAGSPPGGAAGAG
jgi:phosphohistidine phosphatase